MSNLKQNRVYVDPGDPEAALQQLARVYALNEETLAMLRRVIALYPRPVLLYVDEANAPIWSRDPLADKFTFNMETDELVLFSRDPMTFVDAMIEMAMYVAGFSTMMGVDAIWKVDFTIGSWKPVKNHIKRQLNLPVWDTPQWIVGLPPSPEEAMLEDPYPFRTLVSQLDLASFSQMVRLAARDDVEVNFPTGADPRVIQVYIRMKTAMHQVADGLGLADWREFNRRLLRTVQELEEEYQPHKLPVPLWWRERKDTDAPKEEPVLAGEGDAGEAGPPGEPKEPEAGEKPWDPFEAYIDQLFDDEEEDNWEAR